MTEEKKRERLSTEVVMEMSSKAAHEVFQTARQTAKQAVYQDEYASIMLTAGASIIMSTAFNLVANGCPEEIARRQLEESLDAIRGDFELAICRHATETKQ